jgi:hypothetical protein
VDVLQGVIKLPPQSVQRDDVAAQKVGPTGDPAIVRTPRAD